MSRSGGQGQIECVLRGVVAEDKLDELLARLDAVCDAGSRATLSYHERVYRAGGVNRGGDTSRGTRGAVVLRVREHADAPGRPELVHLHPLQRRKTEKTATRQRLLVPTVGNTAGFVEALGLEFSHDFHLKGTRFVFKGVLTVTVCRVYRVAEGGDPFSTGDPVDSAHLVELSGLTGPGRSAVAVGAEMTDFAEQLRPLVQLQLFMEDTFRL